MKLWLVPFLLVISAGTICAQENLSLAGQVVCCADCWGSSGVNQRMPRLVVTTT